EGGAIATPEVDFPVEIHCGGVRPAHRARQRRTEQPILAETLIGDVGRPGHLRAALGVGPLRGGLRADEPRARLRECRAVGYRSRYQRVELRIAEAGPPRILGP